VAAIKAHEGDARTCDKAATYSRHDAGTNVIGGLVADPLEEVEGRNGSCVHQGKSNDLHSKPLAETEW